MLKSIEAGTSRDEDSKSKSSKCQKITKKESLSRGDVGRRLQ